MLYLECNCNHNSASCFCTHSPLWGGRGREGKIGTPLHRLFYNMHGISSLSLLAGCYYPNCPRIFSCTMHKSGTTNIWIWFLLPLLFNVSGILLRFFPPNLRLGHYSAGNAWMLFPCGFVISAGWWLDECIKRYFRALAAAPTYFSSRKEKLTSIANM